MGGFSKLPLESWLVCVKLFCSVHFFLCCFSSCVQAGCIVGGRKVIFLFFLVRQFLGVCFAIFCLLDAFVSASVHLVSS